MTNREAPLIDLTLDGEFRAPRIPWANRIAAWALVAALCAAGLAIAALAFWLAVILIPIAIIAGLVAYAALRFQLWRLRRRGY